MGSVAGGKAAAITNKQNHGDDFYKRIGALGGKTPKKAPSGFAAFPKEVVAKWGRQGGAKSSRRGIKSGQGTSRTSKQRYAREPTAYELHTEGPDVH